MSAGWIVTYIALALAGVFLLRNMAKSLLWPKRKMPPQTHSNAHRAQEYDPAAFIQNGGLNQYPGGWSPGGRGGTSIDFADQASDNPRAGKR